MTFDQIRQSDKLFITPKDIAPVIGCDPQKIRTTAWDKPERLGFPVVVVGRRIRIPRIPFLQFMEGRDA